MVPGENTTEFMNLTMSYSVEASEGRSPASQALWQLVALGVTFGMAIVGGIITGTVYGRGYVIRYQ